MKVNGASYKVLICVFKKIVNNLRNNQFLNEGKTGCGKEDKRNYEGTLATLIQRFGLLIGVWCHGVLAPCLKSTKVSQLLTKVCPK